MEGWRLYGDRPTEGDYLSWVNKEESEKGIKTSSFWLQPASGTLLGIKAAGVYLLEKGRIHGTRGTARKKGGVRSRGRGKRNKRGGRLFLKETKSKIREREKFCIKTALTKNRDRETQGQKGIKVRQSQSRKKSNITD